jgi:hypothetical protein
MKKIRIVKKTEEVIDWFCDRCEVSMQFRHGCMICGRMACIDCGMWDPQDDSDYPGRYCKICWEVGKPFRAEIQQLQERFDAAEEEVMERWIKACES